MFLIAGLGNPGEKYKLTRHNTGFILLDKLVNAKGSSWQSERKFNADISVSDDFVFIKPTTYMNNSGSSVSKILGFYKVEKRNLGVVHDDVDLDFSEVRVQFGSGSAGHKGVEDIINMLGSQDFWRIRVGVGRSQNPQLSTEDWVLQKFTEDELKQISELDIGGYLKAVLEKSIENNKNL
ncbi:aminoacyl-tRNA hydrolase [Patescibacteria group bacterium]|nr:aminoacyl-tRNA hydrolase [Patescibacteria group bacterium]